MIYEIIKDTEEALKYYSEKKDVSRLKIIKEGILYYIKNFIER